MMAVVGFGLAVALGPAIDIGQHEVSDDDTRGSTTGTTGPRVRVLRVAGAGFTPSHTYIAVFVGFVIHNEKC